MAKLGRFAALRVLSGALGLAWVVVVARWMPVTEFAAYAVLLAAVTLASVVGTLGVDRVLYLHIPQAHLAQSPRQVLRLAGFAVIVRLLVASPVAMGIAYATQPADSVVTTTVALAFGAALAAFLVVSDVLAITANALMRFEVQARIASVALVTRLVAAAVVFQVEGTLSVLVALCIVLGGDMLQSAGSYLLAVRPALRAEGDSAAVPPVPYELPPLRGLLQASGTNYASYLFGLPWQGSAAVVLVGATAGASEVALFSLLQNLVERMRQYLPLQLMQNAFEPILVRRYAVDGDRQAVATQVELLRRANFCLLAGAAAIALTVGSDLIAWATHGKYTGAGPLAALLLAALALRGVSSVLFISANVMNEMDRLMRVYGIMSLLSLLPLYWVAQRYGAAGVVLWSVVPSWLLWVGLRASHAHCAVGVWHGRKDLACIAAAVLGAAIGLTSSSIMVGVYTPVLAGLAAALSYFAAVLAFKVFPSGDLALMRANLQRGAT